MMSKQDGITTTVTTNERGDVRIPAEVRRALGFDGEEAILEIEVKYKGSYSND
jgi:bifunctional DNA-binding transcriptional regulator/antitoxin component of YhaV-PrlF toxin-antitoxin module